jgi:hypothetical protein
MPDVDALRIGGRWFGPGRLAVMAIVNRTPDPFYDPGATYIRTRRPGVLDRTIALASARSRAPCAGWPERPPVRPRPSAHRP